MSDTRFSLYLKRTRAEQGWTQEVVARRAGTTPSVISRWETGRHVPTPQMWLRICSAYGVTMEELTRHMAEAT